MAESDFNDLANGTGPGAVQMAMSSAVPPEKLAALKNLSSGGSGDGGLGESQKAEMFGPDGRRIIRHESGKLPEILDELGLAFAAADNLALFVRAERLVRIANDQIGARGVQRPSGTLTLIDVQGAHLVELAGRCAVHEKFDGRVESFKPIDCPKRVADAYLARGTWPELRQLAGFIQAPTVTVTGRVIDQGGFDAETGLFLAMGKIPGYKRVLPKPTRSAVDKAINRLVAAIDTFPFVSKADLSATLAGMLTALLRRLLPAAPMFAITAPSPGTGKTLLADTFAVLATGMRSSVLSLGHDDAETEKRLGGVLLAGDAVILLDNIERPLSGDLLCQVLTQPSVRLRPLGASGMVSAPTSALFVATGNNLAVQGDLKRRMALIRLDAREERPEKRAFNRDHLAEVLKARGELIAATLTLLLAYQGAGAPKSKELYPFGGFEEWDAMVRRPLVWLGFPDPLLASEGLRELDPDLEAMRQLYFSWYAEFEEAPQLVADVVTAGMAFGLGGLEPVNAELRDALQLVCSEKPNSRRLGYWLRAHRDRICEGLQLVQGARDEHAKTARWCVRRCG